MFFGLFKKKKKNRQPEYDKKLIGGFINDHKKLVSLIGNILKALDENQQKKAKEELVKLRMALLGHFMTEDIKLYWYLTEYYKGEPHAEETIAKFKSSIKDIQKEVIKFFDHYAKKDVLLDRHFRTEFDAVVAKLAGRIQAEEESLYTLYVK